MTHTPKQLALDAYLDDALSPGARAHLERHLAGCAVCRRACEQMRLYRETAREVRALPVPDIRWDRVEVHFRRVSSHPPAGSVQKRGRLWLWPAGAVAAALLLTWLRPGGHTTLAPAPPQEAPAPELRSQPVPAWPRMPASVTLAANEVVLEDTHGSRPLDEQEALKEGSTLRTGPHGVLHVRLAEGTGIALAPNTEVWLRELRRQRITLALQHGHLDCQVAPVLEGGHFVVETARHSAHVQGTRFGVSRLDADVERVAVDEGRVQVRRGQEVLRLLTAGEIWSVPANAAMEQSALETGSKGRRVQGLAAGAAGWPWLRVEAQPGVRGWAPLDSTLEAAGTLRIRLPPGSGHLLILDGRGELVPVPYELDGAGRTLTESDVNAASQETTVARWGSLSLDKIQPVVRRGLGGVRACFERSLREGETQAATLVLHMQVSSVGTVRSVEIEGTDLPPPLRRCVEQRVRAWKFPAPRGGPVRLELPLNLKPKKR